MTKILTASLLLVTACGGDLHTPCVTVDDCDPVTADLCAHEGPKSWCSLICRVDEDCPEGPKGEVPICRDLGKARVCSLP
jgi:hypothetical protein